jgi:hypothetical protein
MKNTLYVLVFCLAGAIGHGQTYFLNGDAQFVGGDCYQLTSALTFQNGTVWYGDQIDLQQPFNIQFEMNLGSLDGQGADGICFVLQTVGTAAIGESGGGLGYLNFGTSLGIEFDTWQNGEYNDPGFDHVAIQRDGDISHNGPNNIAGPVQMDPFNQNTEDGQNHVVQIVWEPVSQTISVYFDCYFRTQGQIDLINSIFSGQNLVYWGFTAATGGSVNVQTVCLQENILNVGDEVRVCPGLSTELFAGASLDGNYNWSPTTYLSDPTVANPICTPLESTEYTVTFTNLCGDNVSATIDVVVDELQLTLPSSANITCLVSAPSIQVQSNFSSETVFEWWTTDGDFVTGNNSNSIVVLQPGTYTVYGNIEGVCRDTVSITVEDITETPSLITGPDLLLNCLTPEHTIEASTNATSPVFAWFLNGNLLSGQTDATITLQDGGTLLVGVLDQISGCSNSDTLFIAEDFAVPFVELGPQDSITCLTPFVDVTNMVIDASAPYSVQWSGPQDGLATSSDIANTSFVLPGNYTLEITYTTNGCSASATAEVPEGATVDFNPNEMIFPNVLSPNGDGKNDVWEPYLRSSPNFEVENLFSEWDLRIFNRWGTLVFETASANKPFSPLELSDGAYYYTLTYTTNCGGTVSDDVSGIITVVR